MPSTDPFGFRFPDPGDPLNFAGDIRALAEDVNDHLVPVLNGVETLSFASSGEFDTENDVADPGWRYIIIYQFAAGGGGSGADTTAAFEASAGGGGGQGGRSITYLSKDSLDGVSQTLDCVVGTGGDGGSPGGGASGGSTSFEPLGSGNVTEVTGGGGGSSSLSTSGIGHGAGGSAGGSNLFFPSILLAAADGTSGFVQQGVIGSVGHGGGGVRPFTSASGANGRTPASSSHYGLGGSGAFNYDEQGTSRDGGNGANGRIIFVVVY